MEILISLFLLVISSFQKQDYDYCPSVEEYVSPTTWEEQGKVMRITCYTSSPKAHTYSGQVVHEGGCASNKANLGKVAYLYTVNTHELVAILECNDIGGATSLRNGTSLDIWCPNIDSCWDFIGMYGTELYVIFREAEG